MSGRKRTYMSGHHPTALSRDCIVRDWQALRGFSPACSGVGRFYGYIFACVTVSAEVTRKKLWN